MNCAWRAKKLATVLKDCPNSQNKGASKRSRPLNVAAALGRRPEEMNVPGFNFHPLRGFKPTRYSVHVNGPWCIAFEFE
jgi:proteic killer suppression protein